MKSKTKNLLTEEQIKKLVNVNFGDICSIDAIKELKGGMFNSAYLVEVNGKKMVLKVSAKPGTPLLSYEKNIMERELEAYRLIAGSTDVAAPEVLAVDFSKHHIQSDYFFMTALQGQAMNTLGKKLRKDNLEKIKIEMAGYFAALHKIKGEYFGYFTTDSKYRFSSWREAFLHMVEMIVKDGREHKITLPYDRIQDIVKTTVPYLDNVKVPVLVDYDLWSGNIFLVKEGENYIVEGILDFERAFWGDPIADFPASMMLLQGMEKEENFLKEYARKAGRKENLSEEEKIRLILYKMYIHLIMAVETYRYGFFYGFLQKNYAKSVVLKCIKELEEKTS